MSSGNGLNVLRPGDTYVLVNLVAIRSANGLSTAWSVSTTWTDADSMSVRSGPRLNIRKDVFP